MIIELVGPPGAGKTALIPALVRALGTCGRPVVIASEGVDGLLGRTAFARLILRLTGGRRRRARLLLVDLPNTVRFILGHPRLTLTVAAAILRSPVGPGHRATLFSRWAGVAARQRFLSAQSEEAIVVFDEGFYHRAVNLFAWRALDETSFGRDSWQRSLRRYLDLVPPPEIAVFVDVSTETALARARARGLPERLRGRTDAEATAFLERAARIARLIPSLTAERSEWHRIDNGATIEVASNRIRDALAPSPALARAGGPPRWPVAPRRVLRVTRPDRWWRTRARPLSDADQARLAAACGALHLTVRGPGLGVGSGRSWSVIVDTDRGPAVVKRYKQTLEEAAILAEHGVLTVLATSDLGVPRLLSGEEASTLASLPDGRYAAFRYEPDRVPAHTLLLTPRARRQMTNQAGTALALLHGALATVEPAARPSTGLDAAGDRMAPSTWHADRLARVAGAGDRLRARLCELDDDLRGARLPRTLVHGDFGPYNLLLGPGLPLLVVDFELARSDWRLVDLATALPRFTESRLGFARDRFDAFLAGYRAASSIGREELERLPAVLEFLSLRRAAVCLERFSGTGDARWMREADARMRLADRLADGGHPLASAVRSLVA